MHLVFGEAKLWEDDPSVLQILVFSSEEAQEKFNEKIADPEHTKTLNGYPDENGIGAIFKLRAVKNSHGNYDALIRCGHTGAIWVERRVNTPNPNDALRFCVQRLCNVFASSCETQLHRMGHI